MYVKMFIMDIFPNIKSMDGHIDFQMKNMFCDSKAVVASYITSLKATHVH